jgi:uncharacterized 2Fe-2S/4Fe-4S cluster protein (DUF4445 family)
MTDKTVSVRITPNEAPLDVLRNANIAVPGWCNGAGICGLCRIRIRDGDTSQPSDSDRSFLSSDDLSSGWRLACQLPPGLYVLDRILFDSEQVITKEPDDIMEPTLWPGRRGPGIALDLGTTTVMAAELDERGRPGPVSCTHNRQAILGENVVDRLTAARDVVQQRSLQELALLSLSDVLALHRPRRAMWASIVGNTAMHHLLAGLDVSTLSTSPYVPADNGFEWREIELTTGSAQGKIKGILVPPLGGFVGSDALASVALIQDRFKGSIWILIDIGTNCEVVLGLGEKIFYSSAPAGPAFEGGHISSGMLAGPGAVDRITETNGAISWSMLGEGAPQGLAGTGAVDYVAVLRRRGVLEKSGKFVGSHREAVLPGADRVKLSQLDVRELQKAKAAVEFCVRGVLKAAGIGTSDLEALVVAGGFGKGLDLVNAQEIGLLPSLDHNRFVLGGNLALLGAGLVLEKAVVEEIRRKSRRVVLHGDGSGEQYTAALALRPWKS